jgi:hypothetical protein
MGDIPKETVVTHRTENDPVPPEVKELTLEVRRLELEQRKRELQASRDLGSVDGDLKRAQLQALNLDNQQKHDELRVGGRRRQWERTGTVIAWIAALVPLYYSAWQLWTQREQARMDDRRVRVQAAAGRFGGGPASGAFELALWPEEGIPILVGGVRGVVEAEEDAELSLAALAALERLESTLPADQRLHLDAQRAYLEVQRDLGVERLVALAEPYESGSSSDADDAAFLRCFEINRRIRGLIGGGPSWNDNKESILAVLARLGVDAGEGVPAPPAPPAPG